MSLVLGPLQDSDALFAPCGFSSSNFSRWCKLSRGGAEAGVINPSKVVKAIASCAHCVLRAASPASYFVEFGFLCCRESRVQGAKAGMVGPLQAGVVGSGQGAQSVAQPACLPGQRLGLCACSGLPWGVHLLGPKGDHAHL